MADAARAQRQAALEAKKKRLEELKARRQQRAANSISAQDAAKAKTAASSNLDSYIDGLLKVPGSSSNSARTAPTDVSTSSTSPTENGRTGNDTTTKNAESASSSENKVADVSTPVQHNAIQIVKAETFEMGTQTAFDDFPSIDESGNDEDPRPPLPSDESQNPNLVEATKSRESMEDEGVVGAKVLSTEEVEKELSSEAFSSFLNITSKKVERVLGSDLLSNLLVDYDGGIDDKERDSQKTSDGSKFLTSRQMYECPKWTSSRDVTDMDWSPLHRELMLCSYHMPSSALSLGQPIGSSAVKVVSPDDTPSDSLSPRNGELLSDGLALIWNLAMPNRPEHIFTCGSPVTTVRFHPTESTLIIGGCQSGQIVVWDIRAGRMPVQKSILTTTVTGNSKGHTHPICAMEVIEGGAGLVTAATDGRVNFWSLANLRDPVESIQIGDSVSCLAVSPESGNIICGDDMGSMFTVQSPNASLGGGGQRSRRQVRKLECGDEGHFGMVTSVATKNLKSAPRAGLSKGFLRGSGGLFLSSGVDWTVKLWAPAYTDKSLLSLVSHSYDYMSDIQWNPAHAALMATASSNGTIGLWNFSHSMEEPITGLDGIVVEPDGGSGRGLNKLKWSSDGRRLLAASADRVHVLVLSEDVVRQKGDEDSRMMNHLTSRGLLDRE
eukprot:CAMPEP_0197174618 /NCGR_PEP_ID=MMETSP1423-20130617/1053_1 /TAXON_ID=476441 /ORGANISM="Pseudo-nitzschia heimii, Strain UNC1101" /LENGTH=665 /DNA_ID=CAMNT_0042623561 /DNA_START=70 /DNA_END=2067 /DNA_ORIENTATION=+